MEYKLHAPSGTTIASISYVGNLPSSLEQVQFEADNPANTYDVETEVRTVSDTGTKSVIAASSVHSVSRSASGLDHQSLFVHLVG